MFREYDIVSLRKRSDRIDLPAGAVGTVLLVYPGTARPYIVEFSSDNGTPLGVFDLAEDELEAWSHARSDNV